MEFDCKEKIILKQYMPNKTDLKSLTSFFYAFSDNTSLKIIILLMIKPLCVTDITNVLGINQTTVSHQLKILRSMNMVNFDRDGKSIVYYIKNRKIEDLFDIAVECI